MSVHIGGWVCLCEWHTFHGGSITKEILTKNNQVFGIDTRSSTLQMNAKQMLSINKLALLTTRVKYRPLTLKLTPATGWMLLIQNNWRRLPHNSLITAIHSNTVTLLITHTHTHTHTRYIAEYDLHQQIPVTHNNTTHTPCANYRDPSDAYPVSLLTQSQYALTTKEANISRWRQQAASCNKDNAVWSIVMYLSTNCCPTDIQTMTVDDDTRFTFN